MPAVPSETTVYKKRSVHDIEYFSVDDVKNKRLIFMILHTTKSSLLEYGRIILQDIKCMRNVTLRCLGSTSIAVEKQILHTMTGTAVALWSRCCATNGKVAGSIPFGVSGCFIDIKSFRSHCGPGIDSAF